MPTDFGLTQKVRQSSATLPNVYRGATLLWPLQLTSIGSILEYFVHRVSNGFAEGINNKIKVIKRMAFGFHDFEYFRLKILSVTGYLRPYPRVLAF